MTKFSASLFFLWPDLSLPDAIHAAKAAGFDAVECHYPYDEPAELVKKALDETGLVMLGLNTRRGDVDVGDNGLAAVPQKITAARAAIDEAIAYAVKIEAQNVHVMAGVAAGPEAHTTFVENLNYACQSAQGYGLNILIEPLNKYDAPGYFLTTIAQAQSIMEAVDQPNLKLMFDCYHVQKMEGDISNKLRQLLPLIGHIQFAAVPDRGAPDEGELNYDHIFGLLQDLGYDKPLGAEYKHNHAGKEPFAWMKRLG